MARQARRPILNRIVGHGEEPPDQLLANPMNARTHPDVQYDQLQSVMEQVGWAREILVNRRTSHVVDGHLRVKMALARGEETVPVTYIDVSIEEERLLLLSLDPLAALAGRDADKLAELVSDVTPTVADTDIDLSAILRQDRQRTRGLSHDVRACRCCASGCGDPECGCYREPTVEPEP